MKDQEVPPDSRDTSISMIETLLAPYNCNFFQKNRSEFQS